MVPRPSRAWRSRRRSGNDGTPTGLARRAGGSSRRLAGILVSASTDRAAAIERCAAAVRLALLSLLLLGAPAAAVDCGSRADNGDTAPRCTGQGEPDSVTTTARPEASGGNPISLLTGNKYQREPDFSIVGGELRFTRHYNSVNADFDQGLGKGWHFTFSAALTRVDETTLDIVQGNGRRIRFRQRELDTRELDREERAFRANRLSDGWIERAGDDHVWHPGDGRRLRFRGSYLVRIDYPDHRLLKLFYRQRQLSTVTDQQGRVLEFHWTPGRAGLGWYEEPTVGNDASAVVPPRPLPGHLERLTLPDGRVVHYDHDASGNLIAVRHPDGTARRYHYEDELWPHHLTGLTDRTGVRRASWGYDEAGRGVLSERAGGVERVALVHVPPANPGDIGETEVTNGLGEKSVYRWRTVGDASSPSLVSSEGPGCSTCPETGTVYDYTANGQVSGFRTRDGTEVDYRRDGQGRVLAVRQREPAVSDEWDTVVRYEYRGDDRYPSVEARPSIKPGAEHRLEYAYSPDGLLLARTERGYRPVVARDATERVRRLWPNDPDGNERDYPFDDFREITRTVRLGYRDGLLETLDGPREDVADHVRFHHDERNRLVAVESPDGRQLRVGGFDALGRPIEFRTGKRTPLTVAYDERGHVARVTRRGRSIHYEHDAEGRLIASVDADGRRTRYRHDAAGRHVETIDDLGRVRTHPRDSGSRPVPVGTAAAGGRGAAVFERALDAEGRLASLHDDAGTLLELGYTGTGRLGEITHADGARTVLHHDRKGQSLALRDARGNTSWQVKDDFGQLVWSHDPDTGAEAFAYDAAGNRVRKMTADGETIEYEHDAANRLVREVSSTHEIVSTHDPATGRLASTRNAATLETFRYDEEGDLVEHARAIDGHRFVTRHEHDAFGRLVRKILPDGTALRHHYHASGPQRGRLRAITREVLLGARQESIVAEIDQDARDGRTGFLSPDGLRTSMTHDIEGRPTSLGIDDALRLRYRHDEHGRIAGIDEDGIAQHYRYSAGRLVGAVTRLGRHEYRHDAVGNRTWRRETTADGTTNERYEYPPEGEGNRLLAVRADGSGETRRFDYTAGGSVARGPGRSSSSPEGPSSSKERVPAPSENGRVARRGADTGADDIERHSGVDDRTEPGLRYEHDVHRQPVRVYRGDRLLAEYRYNPFGERVSKRVFTDDGSTTRYYLYDGRQLVAEATGDGRVEAQYVYLGGHRPVARLSGSSVQSIHTDHLGAPRLVTDERARVLWEASYSPHGEATIHRSTVRLELRLPGQYHDAETGTHYNYRRHYDAALGRYLSADPIGLAGGLNRYAYVDGRVLSHVDPLGLQASVMTGPGGGFVNTANVTRATRLGQFLWSLGPLAIAAGESVILGTGPTVAGAAVAVGTVATSPVTLTVVGVGAAALAVYHVSRNSYGPDELEHELGKPSADDFETLQARVGDFSSDVVGTRQYALERTWESYFELNELLHVAQRTYVRDREAFVGNLPVDACPYFSPRDQELHEAALAGIAAHEAGRRLAMDALPNGPIVLQSTDAEADGGEKSVDGDSVEEDSSVVSEGDEFESGRDQERSRIEHEIYIDNGGELSYGDWIAAGGPTKGYPNQLPQELSNELETAAAAGVKPLSPDDPDFAELMERGESLIWAIDENGKLVLAPREVDGVAINHPVLTDGEPVLSAGEVQIAPDGVGGYVILDINNQSGHFMPSKESLELAEQIFEDVGIRKEF